MEETLRKTGISVIGDVPWGTHFCQFYETKEDVIDILVPYFKAGLENNEFCMWITSEPLGPEEAEKVLREAMPDLDQYLRKGQIEILPYDKWYLRGGVFKPEKVLDGWIEKLNTALGRGYAGLRLTGNTFWLEKYLWTDFSEYEREVNSVIGNYNMIAICMYSIQKCGANEILDVMSTHQFALIKRKGTWRVIESADLKQTKQALRNELAERIQTEKALREQEKRFISYIEITGQIAWTTDAEGMVVRDLPPWRKFTGQTFDEIKGWGWSNALHPDDIPRTQKIWKQSVAQRSAYETEYRMRRFDGVYRHFLARGIPMVREDGTIHEWVGTCIDITEREKMEEALRESEEQYRAALETSADGFWIIDMEGRLLEANEAYVRRSGYSRAELLAMRVSDLEAQETSEDTAAHMAKVLREGHDRFESQHRDKNGCVWPVEITVNYWPIRSGRLFVFVTDITYRRLQEKAIASAKQRLEAHIGNSPLAFIEFDSKFRVIRWSDAAEEIFGWKAEEVIGKTISEMRWVYEEDTKVVEKESALLFTGETPRHFNVNRNYRKDGSVIWCEWYSSAIFDDSGKLISVLSSVLDITERRKMEEELRNVEVDLTQAQSVGNIGSWRLDIRKNELSWSDENHRIFGIPKGTPMTYETFLSCVHPDDRAYVDAEWKAGLSGKPYDIEHRLVVNGKIKWVREKAYLEYDHNGNLLGGFGITQDITEKKLGEEALRKAREELEARVRERTLELQQANEALQAEISERKKIESQMLRAQRMESIGTLAAGIAHDFNNILTPIMLNSTAALMDLPKDSPIRKYMEHTLASANRAKNLVQHILTYSRKGEYDLKPLDFQDILMEAIKLVRASLPSTIEIRQKIDSRGPVLADPTQMHQIVMNLCTNAYHAMRESGGILTIALDEVDVDAEFARRNMDLRPGRYVRFTVHDTGQGMDEATMERIFDPFFTTKGAGGTGLGLSVVQGIVISHGGDIDVQSQPGKGAAFHIYLPRAAEEIKRHAPAKKDESIPTGKERILFIDDETEIADMGKEMLERLGYAVTAKTDSHEALTEFRSNPGKYDLIITDYTMPKIDGLEAAREIKKIRPDISIIIASGFNEAVTSEKLRSSGIGTTIMKPYTISDLAKTVRRAIDRTT